MKQVDKPLIIQRHPKQKRQLFVQTEFLFSIRYGIIRSISAAFYVISFLSQPLLKLDLLVLIFWSIDMILHSKAPLPALRLDFLPAWEITVNSLFGHHMSFVPFNFNCPCRLKIKPFFVFQELVEKLSKGELPQDEYPCMNDPSPTVHGTAHPASVQYNDTSVAHSMRSRRTPTWARARSSDDGYSRYCCISSPVAVWGSCSF